MSRRATGSPGKDFRLRTTISQLIGALREVVFIENGKRRNTTTMFKRVKSDRQVLVPNKADSFVLNTVEQREIILRSATPDVRAVFHHGADLGFIECETLSRREETF